MTITYPPHRWRTEYTMDVLSRAKDAGDVFVINECRRFLRATLTTSRMNDEAKAAWSIIREF